MSHSSDNHPVHVDGIISLFHDRKFFWKERLNVDITIRLYLTTSVIEISAYNLDDDVESPKIYCDNKQKLFLRLYEWEIQERVQEIQQNLTRMRQPMIRIAELREDVQRKIVCEFICSRLNIIGYKDMDTRADSKASDEDEARAAVSDINAEELVSDRSTFQISFDPFEGETPFDFFMLSSENLEAANEPVHSATFSSNSGRRPHIGRRLLSLSFSGRSELSDDDHSTREEKRGTTT